MRHIILGLAGTALLAGATGWVASAPAPLPRAEVASLDGDADAGEAVFRAGGCASCHMGPGDDADPLVLSGGQTLASDYGTFRVPNISPDPQHGIGAWTQAQFINAVMRGVAPDGRHYYPAFPYTAYGKARPQDMADLYAYIMTLPADATPSQPHALGFPYNLRRGVGLWKRLYRDDAWVVTGDLTAPEQRGRYLAEALAHCAECHTPRNRLGGLDTARWLAGAPDPSGDGRIPTLRAPGFDWSAGDISAYLGSGFTPDYDVVGGSMAKVVDNLGHLPDDDLDAIAAYILRAGGR